MPYTDPFQQPGASAWGPSASGPSPSLSSTPPLGGWRADDALVDATLRHFDEVVNKDVDMQPPLSEYFIYFVMDTNVLLDKLDVLQQFVTDAETLSVPIVVIIPGIVISELDRQKNRPGLAWSARRASTWLLEKVKERRLVKGQAHEETCKRSGKWNVRDPGEVGGPGANDDLILDCCQYYANLAIRDRRGRVLLCSADKNLCFKGESKGIVSVSPSYTWSSREIARTLFGDIVDLSRFDGFTSSASRQYAKGPTAAHARTDDEDMMDIDDTGDGVGEHVAPRHPLDALHLEVIEHFSALLVELVGRVGGPEVPRRGGTSGLAESTHAPKWAKKWLGNWGAGECVAYLETKKRLDRRAPKLEVFLRRPYGEEQGWRRGQDWSRRDWQIAIEKLGEIGRLWDDRPLAESVAVLGPYADRIFAMPMRPV